LKFFKKNSIVDSINKSGNQLYTQASKGNIKEIFKIKKAFFKLSSNKISEIYNMVNKLSQNNKSKLNMTTKKPSRKHIIILMESNNMERVMVQSNVYITNINRLLKYIKLDISAKFIYTDSKEIIVTMNKVAVQFQT